MLADRIREHLEIGGLRLTEGTILVSAERRIEAVGQGGEMSFTEVELDDVPAVVDLLQGQGFVVRLLKPDDSDLAYLSELVIPSIASVGRLLVSTDTALYCRTWVDEPARTAALHAFMAIQPSVQLGRLIDQVCSGQAQLVALATAAGLQAFLAQPPPAAESAIAVAEGDAYRWVTAASSHVVGPFRPATRLAVTATPCGESTIWTAVCTVGDAPASRDHSQRLYAGAVSLDLTLAKQRAIAEAYERHTAGRISSDHIRAASFEELKPNVVHPDEIIAYQAWQHEQYAQLAPFDPAAKRLWVSGHDIDGRNRWVLADLVFYPIGRSGTRLHTRANSSGMAAHPNAQAAFQNAWYELLERDAFMRCWYGQYRPPKIEIDVDLPTAAVLSADLADRGWQTHLVDLSCIGRPIIGALVTKEDAIVIGAAAADIPQSAAEKALQEAWSILGGASDAPPPTVAEVRSPADHRRLFLEGHAGKHAQFLWQSDDVVQLSTLTDALPKPGNRAVIYRWPDKITQPFNVVRILDPDRIPITFGYGSDPLGRADVAQLVLSSGRSIDIPLFPHPFP